jgi:hypothetical protein
MTRKQWTAEELTKYNQFTVSEVDFTYSYLVRTVWLLFYQFWFRAKARPYAYMSSIFRSRFHTKSNLTMLHCDVRYIVHAMPNYRLVRDTNETRFESES